MDFTKGAHKLSRHLLVEPATYLLEIVRVAILSGATRVDIEYDANDVVIEFDGTSFEYAEVEDLFTRVVSESFDKRLYLLAVAIGAALTVSDGTVTVFGHQRDGTTHSTTYDNDAPGRATPGGKLPMKRRDFCGTLIHVRRSFGLDVAKAAITHSEPREVKLVRDRAARAPIALFIRGQRARHLDPLLRVELGATLGLDVVIELVPVRKSPPTLLFAELGIPVVESAWIAEPWMLTHMGAVPIVVRADSRSLPLNASRSQVQEDTAAETRAFAALGLPKLADAIRERLDRGALDVVTEDAIGAIAAGVRGTHASCFAFLLDSPLLRDGLGRAVSLREVDAGERFGFFIEGDRPLPADHEHIARDVLWLRGRAIEASVLDKRLPLDTVREHVKAGVKRRKRVLAMPSEAPAVDPGSGTLAIRKIESPDGLRGELVLRDPSKRDPRAWVTLRVYLEGHPIKSVTLNEEDGWLPYDAAVAWDGHFEPTLAYDDLRRSPATSAVTRLLADEAARALLEAIETAGRNASAELRALALRALERAPDSTALRALPVFPTVEGRFVALDAIVAIARAEGAICNAEQTPPPNASAPDGRDVFCLAGRAVSIVSRAIAPARILPYDAFLRPIAVSIEDAFASVCQQVGVKPAIVLRDGNAERSAMAGLASNTVVARFHAGYLVESIASEGGFGMVMVTDEPSAFPDVEKQTTAPRIDDWVAEVRSRLVEATVKAVTDSNGLDADSGVGGPPDLLSLAHGICELVANGTVAESAFPNLRKAPLFRMLDKKGISVIASAAQIVEAHPGHRPIPFLPAIPTFSVSDWRVVIAPEASAIDALTKLTRRAFFKATLELRHRERGALASARRDEVLRKERFAGPPPELHPLSPVVELRGDGFVLRAGLKRNDSDERTRATVLYDGREVSRADFDSSIASLTVLADFAARDSFEDVVTLVEPRRSALERALEAAIPPLGRALIAAGRAEVLEDIAVLRFLAKATRLTTGLFDHTNLDARIVRGGRAPLREILSRDPSKWLRIGRVAEVPWPVSDVPTWFDEPILLAPKGATGDALLAALRGAGFLIDDMTGVIAEEVAKRRGEPPPLRQRSSSVIQPVPFVAVSAPPARPAPVHPAPTPFEAPTPAGQAPAPERVPPPPADPVEGAVRALLKTTARFASPPLPSVRYTRGNRAVRYRSDANGGTVELGAGAEAIETLLRRRDVLTLATAALSEVNRELVDVTDQEEVNALLFLLKSL